MAKEFVKKILVAINGSESSIDAAMYAIMLSASCKYQLKVVYIVDSAKIKYLGINQILLREEEDEFTKDLTAEGNSYLDYVQSLAASKGLEIEKELRSGTVYTEIIKAAEEYEADMIIIGSHCKTFRDNRIKRSVISQHQMDVLTNASCPVLVVKKNGIKAEFNAF